MNKITCILRYATIGILALSIGLTACKKKSSEDAVDPDPDLTTERDLSNANNDFNSVMNDIDKAVSDNSVNYRLDQTEATATFTLSNLRDTLVGKFNKYIVMTYTGTGDDGLSRYGSITLYLKVGHTRIKKNYEDSAVFNSTAIDGRVIAGSKWTKQDSVNSNSDKWVFDIKAKGTITSIDGKTLQYDTKRTRTRTGVSNNNWDGGLVAYSASLNDDVWTISGLWIGTNSDGESVSANISSDLVIKGNCNYRRPISGQIDFTNNNKGITRSINYGSGACDNIATFTNAKGKAFQIVIR